MARFACLNMSYCMLCTVVSIEFDEMDYRAVENEQRLTVKISKNKKIAFPLQLQVSPLTITEAKDLGIALLPSIPIDDPMSPIEAGTHY